MKRNNSGKKKQLTLGTFGFKKTVVLRDQSVEVEIPKYAIVDISHFVLHQCDKKCVDNTDFYTIRTSNSKTT